MIEEHFRRSLGKNYKEAEPVSNSVSITGSVDDHFAKALGDAWLQIKAKGGGSQPPEADPWGRFTSPTPPFDSCACESRNRSISFLANRELALVDPKVKGSEPSAHDVCRNNSAKFLCWTVGLTSAQSKTLTLTFTEWFHVTALRAKELDSINVQAIVWGCVGGVCFSGLLLIFALFSPETSLLVTLLEKDGQVSFALFAFPTCR